MPEDGIRLPATPVRDELVSSARNLAEMAGRALSAGEPCHPMLLAFKPGDDGSDFWRSITRVSSIFEEGDPLERIARLRALLRDTIGATGYVIGLRGMLDGRDHFVSVGGSAAGDRILVAWLIMTGRGGSPELDRSGPVMKSFTTRPDGFPVSEEADSSDPFASYCRLLE